MKYSDILQFEPITDVIQLGQLANDKYRSDVVRTFVYPQYFTETIIPEIVRNLTFGQHNRKGVQIIGNYGTGKSHLMSLVSLIAENREYLEDVSNVDAKKALEPIAGKYMVKRFEMATERPLWEIITYQIQNFLDENGVDYQFDPESRKMFSEQLEDMMAAFEEKFPEKGFLLLVDEMLVYLKSHASSGQLNHDLMVLQALGQQCARGRFGFMFGVQEMIYQSKEFTFAADMLLKVKDRYSDLTIRKEEVSFVVQNRLLRKSEQQKSDIRGLLGPYRKFFSEMHSRFEEYVSLYPVHPAYFDNFQNIKHGRAQREVLKTLTKQFQAIMNQDIPSDNPGFITYDTYWEQMMADSGLMSVPDFKTVADTVSMVYSKIESNFTGGMKNQRCVARKIVNAAAIKLLQGDLDKKNGVTADSLVEDLCPTDSLCDDKDFLVETIDSVADFIVRSTLGQYFEKNPDNGEYCLRTSGGKNPDGEIDAFAAQMADAQKDEAFFKFIIEVLGVSSPYRTGFQIYSHELDWRSHRVTRDGYIFLGHPNEKSTTQPKQHFYMVFMPIFQSDKKSRNNDADEIYFVMDALSNEFKENVVKYGAAMSLMSSADSTNKMMYHAKCEEWFKKTRKAFDNCFLNSTMVYHTGSDPRALNTFQLPGDGVSKMEIFDSVASDVFESQFASETPDYPSFVGVSQTVTRDNRDRHLKGAFAKIIRPLESNKDGEAILSGLGCYKAGELVVNDSIYAQAVLKMMSDRDRTQVVNREEILEYLPKSDNVWFTKDYHLDADFEFMVLLVLTAIGECDITLSSGAQINASNIATFANKLTKEDYYTFANIKRPKDVNIPILKEITKAYCGKDLTNQLDQSSTYAALSSNARSLAAQCATFDAKELKHGLKVGEIEIIDEVKATSIRANVIALKGFSDQLASYTSEAKIKNLNCSMDVVQRMVATKKEMEDTLVLIKNAGDLERKVTYLTQAKQYLPEGSELMKNIDGALQKLADVLYDMNSASLSAYNEELDGLKKSYIEWYLDIYHRNCLSDIDYAKKVAIMNSTEYKVCVELHKCSLINTSAWGNWSQSFNQLKEANPKASALLESSPFAGFNPISSDARSMKSIVGMREDLEALYETWISNLKSFVESEKSQEQIALMDEKSQSFINSFASGLTPINDGYAARSLMQVLDNLTAGYEKVEISADELAGSIPTPMTLEEAKAALELVLRKKCKGLDKDKVRIVIK